jgi:hypothetical protein
MKAILISIAYQAVRAFLDRYIDSGFFDRVSELVMTLLNEDIPGSEKRERVHASVVKEWQTVSSIAINLAIEMTLARLELK